MTRVIITGATGALGRAMVAKLLTLKQYEIYCLTHQTQNIFSDPVKMFTCDLAQSEQISFLLEKIQPAYIFHLVATLTNDWDEACRVNVAFTKNLLEATLKTNPETRIILIGSAAEYGIVKPEENPICEDRTLFPVSVYGVTKAWQTQLMGLYVQQQLDIVCARIFNLYGPGLSEKLFAGHIQTEILAYKSGRQSTIKVGQLTATRDYLSTDKASEQILAIANNGTTGHIYHVASGHPITMHEFLLRQMKNNGLNDASIIESTLQNRQGYDVPVIFADMQKTYDLMNRNFHV